MGANERLRVALHRSGLSITALADAAGVDPKTCERWITQGRTPHRTNAKQAALALREDMYYLWPALEQGRRSRGMHPDLVAIYAARADAPLEAWRALFEHAERDIGILVYAAVFLHELWPGFNDMLRAKARAGCKVRVMLGDPDCAEVTRRGQEEQYGHGIETRCRQALLHYSPLVGVPGIKIHVHDTVLYNTIYVGDEWLIVAVTGEVREETGYHIEVTGLVGTYTDPRHIIAYADGEIRRQFNVCYTARITAGELAISSESTELRFVAPGELDDLPIHHTQRLRLRHYLDRDTQPYLG